MEELLSAAELEEARRQLAQLEQRITGLQAQLKAGLEKTRFFFNPAQYFFWFFGLFLWFLGFSVYFYIFAQKREFLGFFQFQEYF
jgi:hypothetical protein